MKQFDPEGLDPPDAEPEVLEAFDQGVARAHQDAVGLILQVHAELALREQLYHRRGVGMILLAVVAALGWAVAFVR